MASITTLLGASNIGDDRTTINTNFSNLNSEVVVNNAKLTADTANVTAAGALMDSEVDADIKTLTLPASTTISTFGASLVDDASAALARATLGVDQAGTVNPPEGTAVLSTGEVGGTKFLREDGDGTCSWQTIAGGGDALVANPLSQFAATTSAQLAGVMTNETGSGALVFGTSPTLVTPELGTPASGVLTNCTGTASGLTAGISTNIAGGLGGQIPYQSAANTTALLSNGTAGQFLKSQGTTLAPVWDTPAGSGDVVGPASSVDGRLALFDSTTGKLLKQSTTIADDGSGNLSGVGTIAATAATADSIAINGSTSGTVNLDVPAVAGSNTWTIPAATDQSVGRATTDTFTNKSLDNASNTILVNTDSYAANQTLTAAQCYGSVIYVTAAATITLPAVAAGMSVTVITIGAVAVSVDANASDLIILDGTALDDGDQITNTSTTGDMAVLTYRDATGWYAATNGWSDGGA